MDNEKANLLTGKILNLCDTYSFNDNITSLTSALSIMYCAALNKKVINIPPDEFINKFGTIIKFSLSAYKRDNK